MSGGRRSTHQNASHPAASSRHPSSEGILIVTINSQLSTLNYQLSTIPSCLPRLPHRRSVGVFASSSGNGLVYPTIYPTRPEILHSSGCASPCWGGVVLGFNFGCGGDELVGNLCWSVAASVVGDGDKLDRASELFGGKESAASG